MMPGHISKIASDCSSSPEQNNYDAPSHSNDHETDCAAATGLLTSAQRGTLEPLEPETRRNSPNREKLVSTIFPKRRVLRRSLSAPQLADSGFLEWFEDKAEVHVSKLPHMRPSVNTLNGRHHRPFFDVHSS